MTDKTHKSLIRLIKEKKKYNKQQQKLKLEKLKGSNYRGTIFKNNKRVYEQRYTET